MTATNLFIAASYASSGDFPQVSRDISERLEVTSSLLRKPGGAKAARSLLSEALADDNNNDNNDADFMSELDFQPRLEEDDGASWGGDEEGDLLFAPRLQALSPSSSFDTSPGSSPAKSTRSNRSAATFPGRTDDSLVKAFSNIQLVSPTYFQLCQVSEAHKKNVASPEELHARGDYNYDAAVVARNAGVGGPPSSTRSQSSVRSSAFSFTSPALNASSTATATATTTPTKSFRNSLSDMVHSVDLSLFPKPLQRLSGSPVMARLGSLISGDGGSSYASARESETVSGRSRSDDSFHTAHMTEAAMGPSPPQQTQQPSPPPMVITGASHGSGISPIRKRHHDGTLAVDAEAANQTSSQRAGLLSPDDIPASTRSKTASSFTANRHPHRILYRLKDGKRGMSQQSKEALTSFLPRLFNLGTKPEPAPAAAAGKPRLSPRGMKANKKKPSAAVPTKINGTKARTPLPEKVYVLLLEMSNKLFEICPIDYMRDMTVGDVLAKVRTNASDPVLAAQKYVSLLSSTIEFSAPMLPLSLILDRNDKKPLLTALPPGTGPDECRRITAVLMGHPTLLRFWANEDPFEPSPAKKQRRS